MPGNPNAKLTPEMEAMKWKPGESGNPAGGKKGTVGLTKKIQALMNTVGSKGKTVADALTEVLCREAIKNPAKMWPFIKEFLDRDEGPVEKKITLDTEGAEDFIEEIEKMRATVPKPKKEDK